MSIFSAFPHLEVGPWKDLEAKNSGFEFVIDQGTFSPDEYFRTMKEALDASNKRKDIWKLWRMKGLSGKFGVIRERVYSQEIIENTI